MSGLRFIVLLLGLIPGWMGAQISNDFVPLESNAPIPASFYNLTPELIKSEIKGVSTLDDDKADQIADQIYFFRKEYAEAGYFYLQNTITDYVSSIAREILDAIPNAPEEIDIYVTRSMNVNAYCMADGTLLVNIGMIAALDNESQLAFILAHEISHYIKQHTVDQINKSDEIASLDNSSINSNKSKFRRLQFSRESEFDADGYALNLLSNTDFDLKASVGALGNLKSADTLSDSDEDLSLLTKYFKSEYADFDSAWVSDQAIEKLMKRKEQMSEAARVTSDFGDLLSTHPELEKRQYAVKEIIENMELKDVPKSRKINGHDFNYIRDLARFEMVENSLRESYYINAIYQSIQLLEVYPENIYLNTTLSKSLYWISYYKEINSGKLTVLEPAGMKDKAYYRIKSVIEHLDVTACKKLSYGNTKLVNEALASNELSLFYLALNTEHYLGKNASYSYYNKYLKEFPKGDFVEFVTYRLSEM